MKKSLAYSVERRAYRKKLSAKRYPCLSGRQALNVKTCWLLVFAFLALSCYCYAQSISSTDLINNAKQYDGKVVTYEGEAIGDIMQRGQYAWININDGKNAIGIFGHKDLFKDILYAGSYKIRGDKLEVGGVFNRACLEHGGDLDIHAAQLSKISSGYTIDERLDFSKRNVVFILSGVLCLALILRPSKRK